MSVYLGESYLLHSDADSPEKFHEAVFAGKEMLFPLNEKYLPADFPILRGSVIAPATLGLPDSAEYLVRVAPRMRQALTRLFDNLAGAIRGARDFDAVFLMKSNDAEFDYSRALPAQLASDRYTNARYVAEVQAHLKRLGARAIPRERIFVIDAACAGGAVTMGILEKYFRRGVWTRALVVAMDLLSLERVWLLQALGAAAKFADRDEVVEGPFSLNRKGFMQADAAVAVIFESEVGIQQGRSRPRAKVSRVFQNSDAETLTAGSQDAARLKECVGGAIEGLDIQIVKAHGTGTPLNDCAESAALHAVFGERKPMVISLKGQIGHALTACGMLELLIGEQILARQEAPAALNLRTPDPMCDLILPTQRQKISGRRMLLNAFGFGGYNASLILEKV